MQSAINIYHLGIKELWSLARNPVMFGLIIFIFSVAIYVTSTAVPESLSMATLAIVDEDDSPLSRHIVGAFYPPSFAIPKVIPLSEVDRGMDQDEFSFTMDIPKNFQRDVLAQKNPTIQLNVDATRISQALVGNGQIQFITQAEVSAFVQRYREQTTPKVELATRMYFNQNLTRSWAKSVIELINNITMLSIILAGAALIREREHGTLGHLLVMPVTPTEIMLGKIWSMCLVVLIAAACSLYFLIGGILQIPIEGSILLFLAGAAVHLLATTSLGIFLATLARSMPQFGMLLIITLLPMQLLSGGSTPRESMPELVQTLMLAAPTTHFVELGQSILYRNAGIDIVWPSFVALFIISAVFFTISLARFRRSLQ